MPPLTKVSGIKPLLCSPKEAMTMLAVSHQKLYELMNSGELQSYLEGRSRKILISSVYDLIEKRKGAYRPGRMVGEKQLDKKMAEFLSVDSDLFMRIKKLMIDVAQVAEEIRAKAGQRDRMPLPLMLILKFDELAAGESLEKVLEKVRDKRARM